jgi:Tfp pilus assembly protein PilF
MPATTQRAEPTRSTGAKGFYERANVFHKKGRLREAKRLYREALRRDPGHVDALNNLAVIYMREKNYSAAERSLEKAIRLKPRNVDTHYNLACVYAIKGELSKSLSQLKRAGTLDPSVKQWALKDSDLKNARNAPGFEKIIKK